MGGRTSEHSGERQSGGKPLQEFRDLSRHILRLGSHGIRRIEFLEQVLETLATSSGCDILELGLRERSKTYHCRFTRGVEPDLRTRVLSQPEHPAGNGFCRPDVFSVPESLCRAVMSGQVDRSLPHFTVYGSFWTAGSTEAQSREPGSKQEPVPLDGPFHTLALIPLSIDGEKAGLLVLASSQVGRLSQEDVEFYEGIAEILGIALGNRRAQLALRERVKELTCLSGIARVADRPGGSLPEILTEVATLLPPGWLYPEIASGRILLDGRSYSTPNFQEEGPRLSASIIIEGRQRGVVEVAYAGDTPELDEGPFLREERHLIDTVAKEISLIVEQREAEEDLSKLEDQLRHADRLATIGQLVAGVAHELNEPLGNILGFAQLSEKSPGLPKQAAEDIRKIVAATLHAREVIRKLMIFARKMPSQRTSVNLNRVVEDSLYFFEARCARAGIRLVPSLSTLMPEVTADPAQLNQVLVNLLVNAVQAMPEGGQLRVKTKAVEDQVVLIVEDTGTGMSEDVIKQIFVPFFTTKDVDQGTGLGLPVVHGIVSAHGGSIHVETKIGQGSCFEIRLPVAGIEGRKEGTPDVTFG